MKGRGKKAAAKKDAVEEGAENKEMKRRGKKAQPPAKKKKEDKMVAEPEVAEKKDVDKNAHPSANSVSQVASEVDTPEPQAPQDVEATENSAAPEVKKGRGKAKAKFEELQEHKESENLVAAETHTKEKLVRGRQVSSKDGTEKPAKTSEEPLPNDQIESSLPAVPVVETKEKRGRGRQAKTRVEAPVEASIEAQEAAPAKRGRGKKAVVSAISEVDSEEEAVEEVKETKAKGKKGVAEVDGKNLTTVGSSNLPVAGPSASVGDVASFDDQSTEAHSTGQRKKSSNKTIVDAFEDIRAMADSLALPKSITDRAKYIFKDVYDGKLLKGRSMHLIASACLHIACRQGSRVRSFKEICAASNVTLKEIGKCHKQVLKALETSVNIITIADFMPRFCINLGLHINVQVVASHIGHRAIELDIVSGRSPLSVAAASIYMASHASGKKLSKKEIRDVAGVSDVTIGQLYELMYPRAAELFPAEFKLILSELPLR